MKKIVFNGLSFASEEFYGIDRHTYELLLELDKIAEPNTIEILAPKCSFNSDIFKNIKFVKKGRIRSNNMFLNKLFSRTWRYLVFRVYCMFKNVVTVNLNLANRYYRFDVMSIYDCTPEIFYNSFDLEPERRHFYNSLIESQHKYVGKSKIVLTDSESAKKDIHKFYDVDLDKIHVVYCGWQHFSRVSEDDSIINKLELDDKDYFFTLGSRMPHKNVKWISYAAKYHPEYTFVVTGSQHGYVDMSFEGENFENIIYTGYLKDSEIKALMKHCKAFILPSLYEGFGIPPLEAMSVGANCIVSNVASLPEVYKNSVWYIDPNDYDHIDLDEIMSKPKECNDLVLNEYSWESSAIKLWKILKNLANE